MLHLSPLIYANVVITSLCHSGKTHCVTSIAGVVSSGGLAENIRTYEMHFFVHRVLKKLKEICREKNDG